MRTHFFTTMILCAVAVLGGLSGCEEREVLPLVEADQVAAYIRQTEEGRELFRTSNMIPSTPYTLPFDDAVYRDFVDSVWRDLVVLIDSTRTYNFGALGEHYMGEVEVTDLFFVTTLRVVDTGATPDTVRILGERELQRFGYFIKLGDDSKPYLGWKLWAYNSLGTVNPPVNLAVKTIDGAGRVAAVLADYTWNPPGTFRSYIRLSDISTLSSGDTLLFNVTRWPNNPNSYYHLVSAETVAGAVTQSMDWVVAQTYVDTVVIPSPNFRLWNIIFVQTFREPPSYQYTRGWCIPYRVPQ